MAERKGGVGIDLAQSGEDGGNGESGTENEEVVSSSGDRESGTAKEVVAWLGLGLGLGLKVGEGEGEGELGLVSWVESSVDSGGCWGVLAVRGKLVLKRGAEKGNGLTTERKGPVGIEVAWSGEVGGDGESGTEYEEVVPSSDDGESGTAGVVVSSSGDGESGTVKVVVVSSSGDGQSGMEKRLVAPSGGIDIFLIAAYAPT